MESVPARRLVASRKVFYIPGFDPFPARRYRELFRKEAQAQAKISGYDIKMHSGKKGAQYWHAHFERPKGPKVQTEFEILQWSDIVQRDITTNWILLNWKWITTAWVYLSKGAFFRLWHLRKGPVIAALYPMGGLLVQNLVMLLFMFWAARFLSGFHPLAAALSVLVPIGLWRLFCRADRKFYVHYLMNDFASVAMGQGEFSDALEKRCTEFRSKIDLALREEYDEVLVIGHSSGAHMAAHCLAPLSQNATGKLSFMSLGQVFAMAGILPKAEALRQDLGDLATGNIPWVDFTSLADGCAFSLCHPVKNLTKSEGGWPLVLSANFGANVSKERRKAMRWRYFRIHFQYLCHFDRPKAYDYFAITCGPQSLWRRFYRREPSPSLQTRYVMDG